MTIFNVLWPGSSAAVRETTPAISSLLAKAWACNASGSSEPGLVQRRGGTVQRCEPRRNCAVTRALVQGGPKARQCKNVNGNAFLTCVHTPISTLRAEATSVRFGVPLAFGPDQAVYGGSLVLRSQMGIAHDHLQRSVPEQFRNRAQIYAGHDEPAGKGMAVAMPRVVLDPGRFEGRGKPAARALQRIAAADRREDRIRVFGLSRASKLLEGAEGYYVQRNRPRVAVLCFRQMNLPALEIDLVPAQTVLLAHAHARV